MRMSWSTRSTSATPKSCTRSTSTLSAVGGGCRATSGSAGCAALPGARWGPIPGQRGRSPPVRLLLPDPSRLRPHLPAHHRGIPSRGQPACGRLAVDLHTRHASLPSLALPSDARCHDADNRTLGNRQGAGATGYRALGLSRYIPLDPDPGTFVANVDGAFHALNLSALSPTLIESELFGHRKGAFTGALENRAGWLESCPPLGAVLLDEIGEVDASIQVKLLRVLQTREFQRIEESEPRQFRGKLIASTNRDLGADMLGGRFREDLYYRLCSDLIVTPSLRDPASGLAGRAPQPGALRQ